MFTKETYGREAARTCSVSNRAARPSELQQAKVSKIAGKQYFIRKAIYRIPEMNENAAT